MKGVVIASVSIVLEVEVFDELAARLDVFEAVAACARKIEVAIRQERPDSTV
ncbi:hypothetical protein [Pseudohoeflea coraliihabitans]|uniref:Uncharacterized protein n=1 Tax=Pseudohoeflea coraliihabitans TaxID=2860393 RepID=A0ABS6WMY3_9HYPH|nr:hypothetical protein [Pseudohoeflea sp. DP4N28-3]MBW3097023.1 hypothetical protein [Pseudohoeflea sp. DP4N28-3]